MFHGIFKILIRKLTIQEIIERLKKKAFSQEINIRIYIEKKLIPIGKYNSLLEDYINQFGKSVIIVHCEMCLINGIWPADIAKSNAVDSVMPLTRGLANLGNSIF